MMRYGGTFVTPPGPPPPTLVSWTPFPPFPSGHRSFYSDSFPTLHHYGLCHRHNCKKSQQQRLLETTELISAVDIYYAGKLVYSKVLETETLSGWFLSSPLRINLLDLKEVVSAPVMFEGEEGTCMELLEEHLTVSWILIDPAHKRAVNVASSKAVEIRRHWLTEEIQLRYSTVVAAADGELVQCGVEVCGGGKEGGELQLNEVTMQVEDMEGKILTGLESLVILLEAMEGQRRKSDIKVEKERFETLKKTRIQFSERKQRREKNLDVVYIATGVFIFISLWAYFC
ncbi:F-box protein [Abeliophyllum distichum]|uniref:F-box protein n=1 Tax=Abeliophyllum distichum TaxID=126358 RepID=A0ABD1TET3_9LAMI